MRACLIILLMLLSSILFAREMRMKTGIADYRILYETAYSADAVEAFNDMLALASDEVYSSLGMNTPEQFRIILCFGAWLFKAETGYDEHTAGIFVAGKNTLVFQNPSALRQRGILGRVLKHELCHSAVEQLRRKKGISLDKERLWLEESFCSALYPGDGYALSDGEISYNELKGNEKKIASFVTSGMSASDYRERRRAYSLAQFYGKKVLDKKGRSAFIKMIVE